MGFIVCCVFASCGWLVARFHGAPITVLFTVSYLAVKALDILLEIPFPGSTFRMLVAIPVSILLGGILGTLMTGSETKTAG